jgi:hypothetical protein
MSIDFNCPNCGRNYKVADTNAGKKFACKDCGNPVQVPATSTAPQVAPPPPAVIAPPPPAARGPSGRGPRMPGARPMGPRGPGGPRPAPGGSMQRRPYGAPPPGGPIRPHRGGMLFAFALLGYLVCGIFLIVALVMAGNDRKLMRQGLMDRSGEGLTSAAYWMSLIGLIVSAIGMVLALIFVLWLKSLPEPDYRTQPTYQRSPYGKVMPAEPKLVAPEWVV